MCMGQGNQMSWPIFVFDIQIEEMFDQQDYYSEEEDNLQYSKHFATGKALLPNSGSDFNHLTGEGESLLKMMQDRGLNINEQELKKLKVSNSNKEKEPAKVKPKGGFMDGGASATYEQLLKALNKALANADPQQASVVLSHILEKTLTSADRNRFGIMKCKILFGLGSYQDCESKAASLLQKQTDDHLVAASLSNYLAKCRAELDQVLEGYMDFLRAKAHLDKYRTLNPQLDITEGDEFADSEIDTITREIQHTEMELNFRMNKYKNSTNLVHPFYPQFRHRQVMQVVCGDYHSLFLVGGPLGVETSTEVFGMGQNSVGQVLGRSGMQILKEPTLIVELSNKKIRGLAANRETSCAWDQNGSIYEWGIKQKRDEQINITFDLGEKIIQFEKGYQHYAALTASKKFYTWGNIYYKGSPIIKQQKPSLQPAKNIVGISCGNNHVAAVDAYGDLFMQGSNEYGQLGFEGELHARTFKKLNNVWLGPIRKTVCLADATFMVTREEQVFFCGSISHNKENIECPRQGQFSGDIDFTTSISGTIGNYFLTTCQGQLYRWEVDSSVKFKLDKDESLTQRAVECSRGNVLRLKTLVLPELTKVKLITENPSSYEDITFELELFDRYGPYGSPSMVLPPKCQIFLSTYAISGDELLKENKEFLQSYKLSGDDNRVLLNQIVESRLLGMKIERSKNKPSCHKMTILSEESGKFYFYVVLEHAIVHSQELIISVSEKQNENSEKSKKQKQVREEERHRKAEMQRQRLLEEKLKKEAEEEEKRKDTQKRAEEAFKKHMREQEEQKLRTEDERKAKKQMMTGGGFDMNKLKAKNERLNAEKQQFQAQQKTSELGKRTSNMMKSGDSFLPDINTRPGSKRKLNMPSKNSFTMTSFDSVNKGERPASRNNDFGGTNTNLYKSESNREKEVKPVAMSSKAVEGLAKTTTGARTVLKRGLSKSRK